MRHTLAVCITLLLATTTGCSSSGGGGNNVTATGDLLSNPADSKTVNGFVRDSQSGAKLAGVTVKLGASSVTTDTDGRFSLTGLAKGSAVVSLEKTSYAPAYENVTVGENAEVVLVPMKREGARQSYNPTQTATLSERTEAGPYAVIFQPNTLNTTDTNLHVAVTPLDPTKESATLPGNLVVSDGMLDPLTFAEFSIFDSAGNRVNLKAGESAVVELPIPPTLRGNPNYQLTKTIHCYSYNPATGQWEDFVVGTVVKSSVDGTTPVVRASIKHFSWYGAAPQTNDCLDVTVSVISAVDKKPMPNARVEAFPGTVTYTDANGLADVRTRIGGNTRYTATRTYTDTNGSVSGMPGAKVIDFGEVNEELAGLVRVPCSGSPNKPRSATGLSARARGASSDPLKIEVGHLGALTYTAQVFALGNLITANLHSIIPGGDEGPGVDGAIITLRGPGISDTRLQGSPAGTNGTVGTYYAFGVTLTPGQRYTIDIDADGNGSIDGSGSAFTVGTLTWDSPANGATVSATGLTASWQDTGSTVSGYAASYYVFITKQGGNADLAYYLGTDRQFTPQLSSGTPLTPGTYQTSLVGFSGAYNGIANDNFSVVDNISGANVTGKFFTYFTPGSNTTFTVQ